MWSSNHDTRENSAVTTQKREASRVLSIELVGASCSKAASVQYMVQFSARVPDLDVHRFRLVTSGSAGGVIASVLRLGGDACLVTVDDVHGRGSMGLTLDADCFEAGAIPAPFDSAVYTIDRVTPGVTRLTVPVGGYYPVGQHLDVGVSYDVPITVRDGTPTLTMAFPCGRSLQAELVAVVGAHLTFRHTVSDDDIHWKEVAWGRKIHLNGATMHDDAGNSVDTTLHGRPVVSQLVVERAEVSAVQRDQSAFDLSMDKFAAYA